MGVGGDQGGSIRIVSSWLAVEEYADRQPASLCGIVGLKPSFGLVPYTGVVRFSRPYLAQH
jgi:amidase